MISDQEPIRALRRRLAALHAPAVLWLLLFAPSLFAQTPAASDVITESLRIVDDRHIDLDVTFPLPPADLDRAQAVAMPAGYSRIGIPGLELPAFARELSMGDATVEILSVEKIDRAAHGLATAPLRDVPITGDSASDARAAAALARDGASGVWPSAWAEIGSAGSMHGASISVLRLNPWRYDAARGRLLCARRMRLRITSARPFDRSVVVDL